MAHSLPRPRAVPMAALIVPLVGALWGCARDAGGDRVTLAAASSLRRVVPELVGAFERALPSSDDPVRIRTTFGASGTLRRQVEAGAPIDGVLLASEDDVERLVRSGHVDPRSRRVLATNRLVLIGSSETRPLTFRKVERLPRGEKLVIGQPDTVPAGRYARDALVALGKWDALADRLVFAGEVAAVLTYVRRREVAAGIVYATDARGIPDVRVLDRAEGPWAPLPSIVGAVIRDTGKAEHVDGFLEFLGRPEAVRILEAHGFVPVVDPA